MTEMGSLEQLIAASGVELTDTFDAQSIRVPNLAAVLAGLVSMPEVPPEPMYVRRDLWDRLQRARHEELARRTTVRHRRNRGRGQRRYPQGD